MKHYWKPSGLEKWRMESLKKEKENEDISYTQHDVEKAYAKYVAAGNVCTKRSFLGLTNRTGIYSMIQKLC